MTLPAVFSGLTTRRPRFEMECKSDSLRLGIDESPAFWKGDKLLVD